MDLPHDFHFAAFINEIIKQVSHSSQWFKNSYKQLKAQVGFNYYYHVPNQQPQKKTKNRTLTMMWNFQKGKVCFEDNPLKHMFVAKNDISENIKERDIFKLKPKTTLNILQKIKKSKIYRNFLTLDLERYQITWMRPAEYQTQEQIFDKIQILDEAKQVLQRGLFSELKASRHRQQVSYMAWQGRSFFKPVFEVWGFDLQFDNLTGIQNPANNVELFSQIIDRKIFNKFPIKITYNKLTNKMFYDAKINIQSYKIALQGQQTFLFLNDIGNALARITDFTDISKSVDPKRSLLPYYQGLDRIRHRSHGELRISVKNNYLEFWPRRKLSRYIDKMVVKFYDLEYSHRVMTDKEPKTKYGKISLQQHMLCFRNLLVSKDPIKQFESPLLNLPLVELQLYTNQNKCQTLNHYLHLKSQNIQQYLQYLDDYIAKEIYVELKLNLPSFGTINTTKHKSLFLPLLIQSYVSNSPVPVANYQRSQLQFLDEILREYVNGGKQDVSGRVIRKKKQKIYEGILLPENKDINLNFKVNAFLGDLLVMFTDFEEAKDFKDGYNLESQVLEPEEIEDETKRNAYLSRYQGIIFSTENLCFQSYFQINKFVKPNIFKSSKTFFRSNYLRLAAINTKNLYHIRHSSYIGILPGSMDYYRIFLDFFEIDKSSLAKKGDLDYEILLNSFKTLFPEYVLNNEQIQHAISEAQGAYETAEEANFSDHQSSLQEKGQIEDYFNFREDDTIGVIYKTSYSQNKIIKWEDQNLNNNSREKEDQFQNQVDGHPIEEEISVRHFFEIDNMHFLYTSKIKELFIHHLIRGFDFKKFRKTDFIDDRRMQLKKTDFLKEYRENELKSIDAQSREGKLKIQKLPSGVQKNLYKEAFFALVLTDPQINCQNEVSKSQLLFSLEGSTTALINSFKMNKLHKEEMHDKSNTTSLLPKDIVKYELCVNIKNCDCYCAPTYYGLMQPTFWINSNQLAQEANDECSLRKIVQLYDISMKVQLLNELLIDNQQPKWAVDLLMQKVTCETDGPSIMHAYCVIQSILLSRGEKSAELVFIEEAKKRDLEALKITELRNLIDRELKRSQFRLGIDNIRPDLARRVEYCMKTIEFTLYNSNKKFSSGLIENFQGKHMIYVNRESKSDVDIDRITLFNHCDLEEYRMVLYPNNSWSNNQSRQPVQQLEFEPMTMIKLRSRDKFVVVREAPWRVYDQIEFFIHPTSLQLTWAFYSELKTFFFENNPLNNIKQEAQKKQSLFSTSNLIKKSLFIMKTNKKTAQEQQKTQIDTQRQSNKKEDSFFSDISLASAPQSHRSESISTFTPVSQQDQGQRSEEKQPTRLDFPSFFRYMRINEIKVQLSYYHANHHLLNIRDFKLRIPPYISHGTFAPYKKSLETYEYHVKKNFISQIPNLIMRKAVQMKESIKDFKTDEPIEEQQSNASKAEMKMAYAKKVLLGDFAI